MPTSNIPTAAPSITGSVVFVDMEKYVTESLTNNEVDDIVKQAEDTFGVQPGNVIPVVKYDISGSVIVDVSASPDQVESVVQNAVAEALNIHPGDIEVTYDPETGVASYVVTSGTAEDASSLQDIILETVTQEDIVEAVEAVFPESSNVKVEPAYGVVAKVELTIDTTNAPDIDGSSESFEGTFSEDWSLTIEGKISR